MRQHQGYGHENGVTKYQHGYVSNCPKKDNAMALPTHPIDNEYIKEWLILGPFFPDDLEADFLANVGGEANVCPREGDTVTTSDGRTLMWTRYCAKGPIIDLPDAVGGIEPLMVYAACDLHAETDGEARLYFSHGEPFAIWVNGQPVLRDTEYHTFRLDRYRFDAKLKPGSNHLLLKLSGKLRRGFALRVAPIPRDRVTISGQVVAGDAPAPRALVRLEQDEQTVAEAESDADGNYRLEVDNACGRYALSAITPWSGIRLPDLQFEPGEARRFDLTLDGTTCIVGNALMLDNRTPHTYLLVEAIRLNDEAPFGPARAVARAVTDPGGGSYSLANLKPGAYQVRCHLPDGYVYYHPEISVPYQPSPFVPAEASPEVVGHPEGAILRIELGKVMSGVDLRFAAFKKGMWKHYSYINGLASSRIWVMDCSPDGRIWFGTHSGITSFDGKQFTTLTEEDGLLSNYVFAIHCDRDGVVWVGSNGGLSRLDDGRWTHFTTKHGLPENNVTAIYSSPWRIHFSGAGHRPRSELLRAGVGQSHCPTRPSRCCAGSVADGPGPLAPASRSKVQL